MKQLHWTKLRGNQIETTLFRTLKPNEVAIEYTELEDLFGQATKEGEGGEGGSSGGKPKKEAKVAKVSHVNPKLLQAIGITLKQIMNSKDVKAVMAKSKKEFFQIVCDAILSLDTNILDVDRLNQLLQGVPEETEVEAINV